MKKQSSGLIGLLSLGLLYEATSRMVDDEHYLGHAITIILAGTAIILVLRDFLNDSN